jgi:hypothetical protein
VHNAPNISSCVKSSTQLQSVSPPPQVSAGGDEGAVQVGMAGPVHCQKSVAQMLHAPLAVQAQSPLQALGEQAGETLKAKTPGEISSSMSLVLPSQSLSMPGVSHSSGVT